MSMVKIGIKLANGEFYPVLEDGVPARKRLVVTTVEDGQRSVQIDLYRGAGVTIAGAAYIGSIVIEDIPEAPKGEPDIKLEFSLDAQGNLSATAMETATGESRSLDVSLEALAEENKYEIPDFEFEEDTDVLPQEATALHDTAAWQEPEEETRRRKLRVLWAAAAILLALLAAAWLVWNFVLKDRGAPAPSAVPAAAPLAAVTTTLPPAPTTTVPASAPAMPEPPATTTTTTTTLAPAARPGAKYRIRWGDTLWDLAYSYYGNPWLYPRIAKANAIRDPDLIIAGTVIAIPPR